MAAARSKRIRPPCFIEVAGLRDLARLTCALERTPLPVFTAEVGGETWLTVQHDLFMGTPIFYYSRVPEAKHFLAYRNTGGLEEVVLTDIATNPTFAYSPVIMVEQYPELFRKGFNRRVTKRDHYMSMRVRNLASLAKVSSYKMLFEEPPLPQFVFPYEGRWVLGTFTRMDEFEESSMFIYIPIDSEPKECFVKYSIQKGEEALFTNRLDDHGYVFVKIIRLVEQHPLVGPLSPSQ